MEFVSVFDEATRDHETEQRTAALDLAVAEAGQVWPFLASALSTEEFGHRLALSEERLTTIAQRHGLSYEDVAAPLVRGFEGLRAQVQVTAGVKCGNCDHANPSHASGAPCSCGCDSFAPSSRTASTHTASPDGAKGVQRQERAGDSRKDEHVPGFAYQSHPTAPYGAHPYAEGESEGASDVSSDRVERGWGDDKHDIERNASLTSYASKCSGCNGTGTVGNERCRACGGNGQASKTTPEKSDTACTGCNGTGVVGNERCNSCGGKGRKTSSLTSYAAIHQALMDGQDPLEWIVAQNPPGGPQYAQVPSGHDTTQQFAGNTPVAYTQAMEQAGTPGRPEQPGGHSDTQQFTSAWGGGVPGKRLYAEHPSGFRAEWTGGPRIHIYHGDVPVDSPNVPGWHHGMSSSESEDHLGKVTQDHVQDRLNEWAEDNGGDYMDHHFGSRHPFS